MKIQSILLLVAATLCVQISFAQQPPAEPAYPVDSASVEHPGVPKGEIIKCTFDHSAIFLLIAGTYTPFTLGPLRGSWGWTMFGVIWALAIFGVIMKATRGASRHSKLALCLYLGMGWLGLIAIRPLSAVVPVSALIGLFAGGIAYTVGVIFFVNEQRRYNHFVWHLFVLAGTGCHFLALLACTS